MFDLGFSEMMVIAIVALIVLGPERLPKVARTLGHLIGRAQRYVNTVKADIHREMELAELKKMQEEFRSAAAQVQQSVNEVGRSVESEARAFEESVNRSVAELEAQAPPPSDASWSSPAPELKTEKIDPR